MTVHPRLALAGATLMTALAVPAAATPSTVQASRIADLKAVFGTVESVDTVAARARIAGTVEGIDIDEGSLVERGQVLATVVDEKLPLELAALDAQVEAMAAQLDQVQTELERARRLRESGTAPQSRLDDAMTAVNVVTAQLAAIRAERNATQARIDEQQVLAPASGRVLDVPVVDGTVVLPGEAIAEIASDQYVLRIHLPERHARFIGEGDPVLVGAAGMAGDGTDLRQGTIRQVYPRIDRGRVEADVTVSGLGDFFVGERTRVYVSAGHRDAIVVSDAYVYRRFGVDYVRLADGREVAVRTGRPVPALAFEGEPVPDGIEILSGLRPGDVLVLPEDHAAAAADEGAAP